MDPTEVMPSSDGRASQRIDNKASDDNFFFLISAMMT